MRDIVLKIRWRLLTGVVALVAAVTLTLPQAASTADLGQRLARVWPAVVTDVADVIWPNSIDFMDVIWPNAAVISPAIGGGQQPQDTQGNADTQN